MSQYYFVLQGFLPGFLPSFDPQKIVHTALIKGGVCYISNNV